MTMIKWEPAREEKRDVEGGPGSPKQPLTK